MANVGLRCQCYPRPVHRPEKSDLYRPFGTVTIYAGRRGGMVGFGEAGLVVMVAGAGWPRRRGCGGERLAVRR